MLTLVLNLKTLRSPGLTFIGCSAVRPRLDHGADEKAKYTDDKSHNTQMIILRIWVKSYVPILLVRHKIQ